MHTVHGVGRAAPLGVAEDRVAGREPGAFLDLVGDGHAEAAQPRAAELVLGVLGQLHRALLGHGALGDHDDGEVAAHAGAVLEVAAHGVDVEGHLGDEDGVGAAGHPGEGGDPAGVAPHDLEHHDAVVGLGRRVQLVDGLGGGVDGREEPDGQLGPADVVVDGLGDADDRQALVLVQPRGRRQRALAADDDQPVEPVDLERLLDAAGAVDLAVGIDARGAEDRAAAVQQAPRGRDRRAARRSARARPCQPFWNPYTWMLCWSARRTMARMDAFSPGQSPPPVRIPMRRPRVVPFAGVGHTSADTSEQASAVRGSPAGPSERDDVGCAARRRRAVGGHVARILSIDEGTTGVRGVVVDESGRPLGHGYREFTQHFPSPGWVEHDGHEIWEATLAACREALEATGTGPGRRHLHRHHQPARDHACCGTAPPANRSTTPSCGRTAAPPGRATGSSPTGTARRSAGPPGWSSTPTSRGPRSPGCWTRSRACADAPRRASWPSGPWTPGSCGR